MSYNGVDDNQFDPSTQDYQSQTLPYDETIRLFVADQLRKMRVWIPVKVTAINQVQNVNLQPLLQGRYADGTIITLPQIQQCPVLMPCGVDYSIKLPVAIGDTGVALFCDRSLDAWLAGVGNVVDPADTRAHDIADPVFIPGLNPFSSQIVDLTSDLVLTNKSAQIRLEKSGGFKIQNTSSNQELISNLINLVNTLSTASTVAGGPFIGSVVTVLNQIVTNLTTLQG